MALRIFSSVLAGLAVAVAASGAALACEKLIDMPTPRIEEMMEVMKDSGSSELKQLLAFEELACSNRPAVRKFAVDTGLASKSKSLRSQSLAILLMQRDQVRLDLLEELKGDRTMEQWIRSNGRSVAYKFHEREATQNCISLAAGHKCPGPYMIAIDGLNIRIIDPAHHLTGTFALQPDNSLRGTILVKRAARPVAAKIELEK
ncbi:hypothetical protein [Reyranella massiliensis]|uniref:hypothetical protein n=1 Tax=Reyranella massiliensis TaxID=445220 RepID=UPI0002D42F9F|nr:hypothetical protein [Reyranella massiliensis]